MATLEKENKSLILGEEISIKWKNKYSRLWLLKKAIGILPWRNK